MITTEIELLRNQVAKQREIQIIQDQLNDAGDRLHFLAERGLKSKMAVETYGKLRKQLENVKS